MKQIEPENLIYPVPDFGFDNELTFIQGEGKVGGYSAGWQIFGDYMKEKPFNKYERLKNYISFVTDKMNEEKE